MNNFLSSIQTSGKKVLLTKINMLLIIAIPLLISSFFFFIGEMFQTGVLYLVISLLLISIVIIPYTKFGKKWIEETEKNQEETVTKQAKETKKLAEGQLILSDETPIVMSLWNTFVGILNFIFCLIVIFALLALVWFIIKGLYGLLLFGVRQI